MTSKERVMAALNNDIPDKVPWVDVWDKKIKNVIQKKLTGADGMNEAEFTGLIGMDALEFYDLDPPIFCEKKTDSDGNIHNGDGLITSRDKLHLVKLPDENDESLYDSAKRFIDAYGDSEFALFAGIHTGMMHTIYSMGHMSFSVALYEDLELIREILQRYSKYCATVYERLQAIGFDFLMSYDDVAFNAGPLMSPQVFRELFLPHLKEATSTVKVPWGYHSDGNLLPIFEDLLTAGMNAVNPFQPDVMDIADCKKKYGDRICVWGNIDLNYTLTRGTPEEVTTEVNKRLSDLGPGGGYIISSANTITDYCKPANIIAMSNAIKNQ